MIIDTIEKMLMYEPLVKGLSKGVAKLYELPVLEEGRYEFEGGFFTVQSGETRSLDDGTFELHRNYIDVQIMLEGCEELAWSDISSLKTVVPYNAETDIERLDGKKDHHILITKGMFYIAFPQDGHKAISHTKEIHKYKKAVMKLPITGKM